MCYSYFKIVFFKGGEGFFPLYYVGGCSMKFFGKKKILLVAVVMGAWFLASPMTPTFAAEKTACAQEQLNDQMVLAAAWMQNSAEYRELCYQAYNIALGRVEAAVANHQKGDKPLAIVLDVDETVLDNSAFDAGYIGTNNAYSVKDLDEWCNTAEAPAMPGAAEYLQAVDKLGVDIFYVSNRSMAQIPCSKENFKRTGFPQADEKHLIFQDDSSNKIGRFEQVMKEYDVVVFMGDRMSDLPIDSYHKSQSERNALVDQHKDEFGKRFIVLPNPIYGDWEPALKQDDKPGSYWELTAEQKSEVRKKSLRVWRAKGNK